jgi:hypothetical protein
VSDADADAARASDLYEQAVEADAQRDYWRAYELVQQSLALREDDDARALYRRVLATVGPA